MASEILKLHKELKNGSITCTELVKTRFEELENSSKNTANFLLKEMAYEMASKTDQKIKNGQEIGILEGIPFGIKDVYLLQGCNASASSAILKNYVSPYTATAIQKLIDSGAIPIVKENCDSFGHGSTNENSIFGPVKNAFNDELVSGGSSGGSAVNVAKGYTAFSIGGDTGGSIRQPAGYNKVFGLKPSYGRISRYGLMAYTSSTDCVGPIANSLEDILLLLNVMSGIDGKDQTTYKSETISEDIFSQSYSAKNIRVGYYKNFIHSENISPSIKTDFLKVLELLKQKGVEVKALDFYDDNVLVSAYYVLAMAETASNLARLDGSNFGSRSSNASLKESYLQTRSKNFSEETQRRIIGGNQVLSHGHAEEIYRKAQILRQQITQSFNDDFKEADIILSPVTPCPPPKIGSSLDDPMAMYLSDAYTVGFSIGGLPTLTAPFGTETGIQITAAHNQEENVLKFTKFLKDIIDDAR